MSDSAEQYERLVSDCGWRRVEGRTQLRITGADARNFLHNYCTADLRDCRPGDAREAFITSVQGKTLGHGFFFLDDKGWMWDADPGRAPQIMEHLDRYVIREDVAVEDLSATFSPQLWVAGANAEEMLRKLELPVPPSNPGQAAAEGFGANDAGDSSPPSANRLALYVRALPVLNCPCYGLVSASRELFQTLHDRILTLQVPEVVESCWEALRIEAGFPRFGTDIDVRNLPQEVGRDAQAISFTKGCYLGQETVARIDALGHVNRYLRGLRFHGQTVPSSGLSLYCDQKSAGEVTSAVLSPKLAAPLALGYIRREHASAGSELESEVGRATVVELPLGT